MSKVEKLLQVSKHSSNNRFGKMLYNQVLSRKLDRLTGNDGEASFGLKISPDIEMVSANFLLII